ncbi:MAG: CoA transferase [Clostridia bacterium]|nr:CoA transferase [Clostridia bacterium]
MKPLIGLKVLDLTDGNPYIGSMFADYGAEVIKIEAPGRGDTIRRRGARAEGEEGIYQAYYNRAKKSMAVDLASPRGQEIVRRMAAKVDMLCANCSEERLAELGLGYKALKALNPKLIYGILTPFGEEGPWKDLPDYDLIVMARSGLLDKTGFPERPTRIGFPLGYYYGSWYLTAGMLAAYLKAQETGEGQKVSTSSWQAVMSVDDTFAQCLLGMNELPKRIGNGFPTTNPTDTFKCKNGWFALSIGSDQQWWAFSREAGRQDWIDDPRYSHDPVRSMEHYFGDLDQQLRDYFATITIEEADAICRAAMVPGGPCNTVNELVSDDQVKVREMILPLKDPKLGETLQIGKPAKFLRDSDGDNDIPPAPALGEHTETLLQELLQLSGEEITALRNASVI